MTVFFTHFRPIVLVLAAMVLFGPTAATAQSDFVATPTFVASQNATLPFQPSKLAIAGDKAYVIGGSDEDGQILVLDAGTLETLQTRSLPFQPFDIATSFDGKFVYVIGNTAQATTVLVMGSSLDPLGRVDTPSPVAYPSIKMAQTNLLIVAGLLSDDALGTVLAVDASNPTAPAVMEDYVPVDASFIGPVDAWLEDGDERTVFLNVGFFPALVAYGVGEKGNTEHGDISFGDSKTSVAPLTVAGLMSNRLCLAAEDDMRPSFLIVDNSTFTLLLAAFDPLFKSLDVLASSVINPETTSRSRQITLPGTDVVQPTGLLTTSCNQGVIWIGNIQSTKIEQFAVNPDIPSLEKTGDLALPAAPIDIKVNESGGFGLAVSARDNSIIRFQSGDGGVIGTEAGRSLQRALTEKGFPVGAIDGLVGTRTLNAVSRLEQRNDIHLDVNNDIEGAIQMILELPTDK